MVIQLLTELTEVLILKENLSAKVQLMIEPSLIEQIDNWRYENRISSRSRAMRHLMSIGLVSCNEKSPAEAATSPSDGSTNPHEGKANEHAG